MENVGVRNCKNGRTPMVIPPFLGLFSRLHFVSYLDAHALPVLLLLSELIDLLLLLVVLALLLLRHHGREKILQR